MNRRLLSTFVIALFVAAETHGMFARQETEKVPIDRLLGNLEKRLQSTNDFETLYYLARVHSMAYAVGAPEISVRKKAQTPQFDSPGQDAGVPREIKKPANAASAAKS